MCERGTVRRIRTDTAQGLTLLPLPVGLAQCASVLIRVRLEPRTTPQLRRLSGEPKAANSTRCSATIVLASERATEHRL